MVRVEQLVNDVVNGVENSSGGVQQAMLRALRGVLRAKGAKVSSALLERSVDLISPMLAAPAAETRHESASTLGCIAQYLSPDASVALIDRIIANTGANSWEHRQATSVFLTSVLNGPTDAVVLSIDTIASSIEQLAADDNVSVRTDTCGAASRLLQFYMCDIGKDSDSAGEVKNTSDIVSAPILGAAQLLMSLASDSSGDVRVAACHGAKQAVAAELEFYKTSEQLQDILIRGVVGCAKARSIVRLRGPADQALAVLLQVGTDESASMVQRATKLLGGDQASFLKTHIRKLQKL